MAEKMSRAKAGEMLGGSYYYLFYLLQEQGECYRKWERTRQQHDFGKFLHITKMLIRLCLTRGLYDVALPKINQYVRIAMDSGMELDLPVKDPDMWMRKYNRCISLNSIFYEVAKNAMDLYKKATTLFHILVLEKVGIDEFRVILKIFQECATITKKNPEAKLLHCQSLHECGDVCREIGRYSKPKDINFLKKALVYYDDCIRACEDKFQDSIVADNLIGKAVVLIEISPTKHEKEIRKLFDRAYDLYKTAKDRATKVKIIADYTAMLDDLLKDNT